MKKTTLKNECKSHLGSNKWVYLAFFQSFAWVGPVILLWSAWGLCQARIELRDIERMRIIVPAESYLRQAPVTITAFPASRSAGGIHDFFSEGDYWWPDPNNPDGPYIQSDGMTNPDNFVWHRKAMIRFSTQAATLTSAYVLTKNEIYAEHAVRHMRAWFIDDATKMNPHLKYAQAIKGRSTGRGTGIIDTVHLIEVARSALVLAGSKSMRAEDLAGIRSWFAEYLRWMTTNENGIEERDAKNNHGTCWVMQVAAFAQLTANTDLLDYCRKRYREVLLPNQMAADGSYPLELRRTKPYGYSIFNLDAFATICQILSSREDNLWEFTLPDGRGIRKGMEYLYPYLKDKSAWPHAKDVMYFEEWPVRQPCLLFAGLALNEPRYLDLWKGLNGSPSNEEVIRNLPIRNPLLWVQEDDGRPQMNHPR